MALSSARRWFKERWLRLAAFGLALVSAALLCTVCNTFPEKEYGGFNLPACLMLGPVVWPIAFATTIPLPPTVGAVALLAYWPLLLFVGYRFLVRRSWWYALPTVLLLIVPAASAAGVFVGMMGV
jgi:hypothetical protein